MAMLARATRVIFSHIAHVGSGSSRPPSYRPCMLLPWRQCINDGCIIQGIQDEGYSTSCMQDAGLEPYCC